MYSACVFAVLLAVASAALPRSDPAHHVDNHHEHEPATPQHYEYAASQQFPSYYDYGYQPKTSFLDTIKTEISAFINPLLTVDTAILALVLAGLIFLFNWAGIFSINAFITTLSDSFGLTVSARNSRMFKLGKFMLGDDMDRLSEIVGNAIDNVEKWKDM